MPTAIMLIIRIVCNGLFLLSATIASGLVIRMVGLVIHCVSGECRW